MSSTAIVVTGLGAVSACGEGVASLLAALREGRDALSEMEREEIRALFPIRYAGWLRAAWERGEKADLAAWARAAAREAWEQAGAAKLGIDAARVAVVVGTTIGEGGSVTSVAEAVAAEIGARGPRWTVSTACASGAAAIGLGRDLLLADDADLVLAGGAERLVAATFAGFAALGVLAQDKCAPFGETFGTTLGEGAGFVVLERSEALGARRAIASLAGYGLSSDAWHETSPDPRGEGLARAISACLRDAGIEPHEVDYVNAHATGTAANDDAEWRGIRRALGARAGGIPISASKGCFGHAQGAAGALEAIVTMACMLEGLVPPSLRVGRGRSCAPPDVVAEGRARPAAVSIALSNSAAFGGANAVLGFARGVRAGRARARRAVSVVGVGVLSTPKGAARDDTAIAHACGDIDLRGLDPSARYAVGATARALADAHLQVRGAQRDRTGIFGGANRPPAASVAEFERSLARGLDRASAPAFARTVGHAPIATASRCFGLRGPMTMVAGEGVAGLLAIACAARWLRDRDDADHLLAGGIDERPEEAGRPEALSDEGAAMVVLAASAGPVCVAGVATAGSRAEAAARALGDAGRSAREVEADVRAGTEQAGSLLSALAAVRAVCGVREGARVALVTAEGANGAVALVLVGDAP